MKRLVIIGLGDAGRNHLKTLAGEADAKVVAVVDVDAQRAEQQAKLHNIERWFTDYRQALALDEVDAVVVSTPPFMRREIVIAAAKAGKDILAEKPFGITSEDARAMIAAINEAGVRVMVNFGTRNLPAFQKVRELVTSGQYGRPVWAWCKYMLISSAEIFQPPGWFWKKDQGGGHLVENAGHAIDFICQLLGPAATVTGMATTLPLKDYHPKGVTPDIENMGMILTRHANGGVSMISNGCNAAGGWGMDIDILTDTSMISLRKDRHVFVEQNGKKVLEYEAPVGWSPIPAGGRAFLKFLRGDTDGRARPEDGLRAIRIAEAAYEASDTGRVVALEAEMSR